MALTGGTLGSGLLPRRQTTSEHRATPCQLDPGGSGTPQGYEGDKALRLHLEGAALVLVHVRVPVRLVGQRSPFRAKELVEPLGVLGETPLEIGKTAHDQVGVLHGRGRSPRPGAA